MQQPGIAQQVLPSPRATTPLYCDRVQLEPTTPPRAAPQISAFTWQPAGTDEALLALSSSTHGVADLELRLSAATRFSITRSAPPITLTVRCSDPTVPAFDCTLAHSSSGLWTADHLQWIVRQYSAVDPPDQNHDPSPYSAGCCCQCAEGCGLCTHNLFDCCGTVAAILCTCGCYPTCKEQHQPLEIPSDESSGCYRCCHTTDWSISAMLSVLALPTRCCGRWCGIKCRNLCPIVHEHFAGPPDPSRCAERGFTDCVGGFGSCYTHVFKGAITSLNTSSRRVVKHCCIGCRYASIPCATDDCRGACMACAVIATNCIYCVTLGYLDALLWAPLFECLTLCLKADVYLQGHVLLQGYLAVSGSCIDLPDGWVVLRPWALAVYNRAQDVAPGIQPVLLLPCAGLLDVSPAEEDHAVVQIKTLDFSRFVLKPPSIELYRDGFVEPIAMETWRAALEAACARVESLKWYDQGTHLLMAQQTNMLDQGGELVESNPAL